MAIIHQHLAGYLGRDGSSLAWDSLRQAAKETIKPILIQVVFPHTTHKVTPLSRLSIPPRQPLSHCTYCYVLIIAISVPIFIMSVYNISVVIERSSTIYRKSIPNGVVRYNQQFRYAPCEVSILSRFVAYP